MPNIASSKLKPLEYRLHRQLTKLPACTWVVACSGGLDSVVLLYALARVAPRLALELEVAYVHHGSSQDAEISGYRDRARVQVKAHADLLGLTFVALREDGPEHKSEAELRTLRKRLLEQHANGRGIVLAHHADDLLETRLLRLLRGTGAQGIRAMRCFDPRANLLRPFLKEPKTELAAYARGQKLAWLEDPSNQSLKPLRNWVRNEWLPQLEARRPGAVASMSRSLDLLAEECDSAVKRPDAKLVQLDEDFEAYLALGDAEQRRQIASLLLHHVGSAFTEGQILEIQKRLNAGRSRREFVVAGVLWTIERSTKWHFKIKAASAGGEPNALVL